MSRVRSLAKALSRFVSTNQKSTAITMSSTRPTAHSYCISAHLAPVNESQRLRAASPFRSTNRSHGSLSPCSVRTFPSTKSQTEELSSSISLL
jgi:hypothetical protein